MSIYKATCIEESAAVLFGQAIVIILFTENYQVDLNLLGGPCS